jgi:hypothetical protein
MSKILIPFVYHENIDHQFYLAKEYRVKKPGQRNFDSSMFRTGIRKAGEETFDNSYLILIDLIMLYDEVYISVDDLIYLYSIIGKDDTELLINSGALKLYDSFSVKLALYPFKGRYEIFANFAPLNKTQFSKRIKEIVKFYPKTNKFQDWHTKAIIRQCESSFYVNEFDKIISSSAQISLKDVKDDKVVEVIKNTSSVPVDAAEEEQLKMNRLLHFHYYVNLTKHINCEYLYLSDELIDLFDYYEVEDLLKEKITSLFDTIIKFDSVENLPDITSLVKLGKLSIADVIQIRKSKNAKKFRQWLNRVYEDNNELTSEEITKIFHEACMSSSTFEKIYKSKEAMVVKSLGAIVAGFINPGLGIGITTLDAAISLFPGDYHPNRYTEKYKKFIKKNTQ